MDLCGNDGLFLPSSECDSCEAYEQALEQVRQDVSELSDTKQDKLTPGANITIEDNVISATGGGAAYTPGDGISIINNVIAALRNPDNTYTKEEVDALLGDLEHIQMKVVDALPATGESNIIYLVPRTGGGYDQWVWASNQWADIGAEDVDLTGYVKTTDAATANPLMDGTAAVGAATKYAREDHRHPTDTTRAPIASPTFTGTPKAPTQSNAKKKDTQIATTAFVQNAINNRMIYGEFYSKGADGISAVPTSTNKKFEWSEVAEKPGYYVGSVLVRWPNNSTGRRVAWLSRKNADGTENGINSNSSVNAVNGASTDMMLPFCTYLAAGDGLTVTLWQNSGSNLTPSIVHVRAIGFGDSV